MELTVACVLSKPQKNKPITYTKWHVDRLRFMVDAKLPRPHDFICIDDSQFPGWWAKIELFKPGRFSGRVLYLDLDVTIVADLGPLVDYPAEFAAIRDYGRLNLNSSVMVWNAGVADNIYNNFKPEMMERYNGDQDYITDQMREVMAFPRTWVPSFKADTLRGRETAEAKVRVYHGKPKPWDIDE